MTMLGKIEHGRIVLPLPLDFPDGTSIEVDLRPLPTGFWNTPSISDFRRQQKTEALRSVNDLAGDWPDSDSIDDFLVNLREGRA